jgi:glucan 1,3-beta-glucosidase
VEEKKAEASTSFIGKLRARNPRFILYASVAILTIIAIVLIPIVLVGVTSRAARRPKPVGDEDHRITTPGSPGYKDPFDDSARSNPYSPPLNQPFSYNDKHRIRGINIGGWLVLEPYITPKMFEQKVGSHESLILDEWTLCERLGPDEAKRQLKEHYETFITEADFKKIAEMGFNHVRIPTGHWALQVFPGEPFVPHVSWQYLLRGIQWARKYGLRVMVELHTAPGSQNGWNHSGRAGTVGFLNGTDGDLNAERTTQLVTELVRFFNKPEWAHVVPVFGVLNEPATMNIPEEKVQQWYQTSYDAIRKALGQGKGPFLTFHDGFIPLHRWRGFFGKTFERVVLGKPTYVFFSLVFVSLSFFFFFFFFFFFIFFFFFFFFFLQRLFIYTHVNRDTPLHDF